MKTKIKKVLLVVNPISGDTDKNSIIYMVKQFLLPQTQLDIFRTTGKSDMEKLSKRIRDFCPDRILVAGGDGTIKMTAQACEGNKVTIGIIPAGSANGLATDLDIPKDSKDALVLAMTGKITKMDAIRINTSIGLHISDMGINAELIKKYSDSAIRGHFGYFLNSIPTLLENNGPHHFTIFANGQKKEVEAIMVAFANSKKFGTGAVVNPNGKIDDGTFEILIFKKLDVLEILKTLQGNIAMQDDFLEIIPTTEVRVTTKTPIAFQIDGEPEGELKNVTASIIPGYVDIVSGL